MTDADLDGSPFQIGISHSRWLCLATWVSESIATDILRELTIFVHDSAQLPINVLDRSGNSRQLLTKCSSQMAGFYIHSAIHHARPEVESAAHCHSLHGKAWSTFGRTLDIVTQDSCLFYDNQAVYKNFGGIVCRFPLLVVDNLDPKTLGSRRTRRCQYRSSSRTS